MRPTDTIPAMEVVGSGKRILVHFGVWVVIIGFVLVLASTLLAEHQISLGVAVAAEK